VLLDAEGFTINARYLQAGEVVIGGLTSSSRLTT
jgi:hypothetical protein